MLAVIQIHANQVFISTTYQTTPIRQILSPISLCRLIGPILTNFSHRSHFPIASNQLVWLIADMSSRSKNPVATRAKILQSAHAEFVRYGLHAARLNAIVENAGITKGSLFHHFAGKEDLASQWLAETLPPLLDELWLTPLATSDDALDALQKILREQVRRIEAIPAADFFASPLVTVIASINREDQLWQPFREELQQQWHKAIADALARGQAQKKVHSAIVATEEASLIISLSMGLELQAKIMGYATLPGLLRSAMAYLDTLRPA
jgi:TetR/AcrR family transcriptional repressor of nem operon